jgi:hypothetical protein
LTGTGFAQPKPRKSIPSEAYKVEMPERIERKPPGVFRGIVAEQMRRIAVSALMERQRDEQHRQRAARIAYDNGSLK